MGEIIKPEDFIQPAHRISALVGDLLGQPSLHHVEAEAQATHGAILAARDALEALVDLVAGE